MINDVFNEQLVKRQATPLDTIKAIGIWVAAALISLLLIRFIPYIGLMIAVLVFWLAIALTSRLKKEYEYILTNGDLDIDVIFNQAKRKRMVSIDCKKIIGFEKVHDVNKSSQKYPKTMDCSSGKVADNIYGLVYDIEHKKTLILIEPNEAILKGIYSYAPKSVTGVYGVSKHEIN